MSRKADGTIYIDTNIDTGEFSSGIKKMESSVAGLSKGLKKLGIAIGSIFAIKELVAFGKAAIDLGSDLQEVQNVVDVTFTTLSEEVDEFAKAAAKTAGLSEAMAKRYVGTFGAMAKAFGFSENNALEMSKALTQLSGDVASFYNLSQDEAYTKLKSVFTGETEALKELGVVMTQSALDSFAMAKGFGKVTNQMSEQEKVALRYSFIMDQLAIASGDFIRTSDGWANQTRILRLNIDSLKASIGQGLINILTPAIQIINLIVEKLGVLANKFMQFTELITGRSIAKNAQDASKKVSKLGENYALSSEGVDDFTKSLSKANKEAKKSLSPLDNLNNITSSLADNLGDSGFGNISVAQADASLNLDGIEEVGRLEMFLSQVAEQFKKVKDVIVGIYNQYLKPVFSDFGKDIKNFATLFVEWFGNKIIPILTRLKDMFITVFNTHVGPLLVKALDTIQKLWNAIKPFIEWLADKLAVFLPPVLEGFGIAFINVFAKIMEIVSFLIDALNGLIDFIVNVFAGNWEAAWKGILDFFKGIINALISAFEGFINFVVDALNALINGANDLSSSVGINLNIGTIPRLNIPKLATGAVIPPNAPFMAMLGDQKHGTNIEAPLDTIKQALAEVMAEIHYVQNDRPIIIEIGGKEVFHVVQREAEEYFEATGREAFT